MSDLYIKEAAALMEQAKGALASGADQAKSMAGNVDVQKLIPYLLAGGAGAVGGAALSGRRKERQGETRGQYLTRILRNAVTAGALTSVGSYAAAEGLKKTVGKIDLENPITGTADDQGPLAAGARRHLFSPLAAAGAGVLGLGLTARRPGIGANPEVADAGEKLIEGLKVKFGDSLPPTLGRLKSLKAEARRDPSALRSAIGTDKDLLYEAKRLGLNIHDPKARPAVGLLRGAPKILRPALKTILRNTSAINAHRVQAAGEIPSKLMGRTTGRRVGRGALGLGAALIPAVIGSILTDRPE